jgi:DNA-binding transcriptional LysR family regulator
LEWSDIKIFLAVARASTLGGAAKSLDLSHPTIVRRIRALEAATGQTLFQRTADGFVLTDEGNAVLSLAETMEENALTIERRLAGDSKELEGRLRISSADWFGAFVLPTVLAAFRASNPHVELQLLTGTRLFSLAQREADVVFRIIPFDEPDVVQRRLLNMQYGVYVNAHSPEPVLGDGSGFSLITMDTSLGLFPDVDWLRHRYPKANVAVSGNNRHVQARLCAAGLGIAVLPRPVGDHVSNLRRLDVSDAPPERAIWMGYHRDLRRLSRLRAFVELTVATVAT